MDPKRAWARCDTCGKAFQTPKCRNDAVSPPAALSMIKHRLTCIPPILAVEASGEPDSVGN